MRRICRIVLIALVILGAAGWAVFYLYVNAMACAFGSANTQTCQAKWPWELGGDDLMGLAFYPGGVLALMLLGIWLLRPKPFRI